MTFNIRQETIRDYYISCNYEPFTGVYNTTLNRTYNGADYHAIRTTRTPKRTNALAAYRRYVREVKGV